jgi:hypothetical protein
MRYAAVIEFGHHRARQSREFDFFTLAALGAIRFGIAPEAFERAEKAAYGW